MKAIDSASILVGPFSVLNYSTSIAPIVVSLCEYSVGTDRYLYQIPGTNNYTEFLHVDWYKNLSQSDEIELLSENLMGENLVFDSNGNLVSGVFPDYKILRSSLLEDKNLKITQKNNKEFYISSGYAIIGGVYVGFSDVIVNIDVGNLLIMFDNSSNELTSGHYFVTICPKYHPLQYNYSGNFFAKDNCFVLGLMKFSDWKVYVTQNYTSEKYQGLFCNLAVLQLGLMNGELSIVDVSEIMTDSNYNFAIVWSRRSHLYPYVRNDITTDENNNLVIDFGSYY